MSLTVKYAISKEVKLARILLSSSAVKLAHEGLKQTLIIKLTVVLLLGGTCVEQLVPV